MATYVLEPTKIAYGLQQEPEAHSDRLTCILGKLSHLQADMHEKKMPNPMICGQAKSILEELCAWNANRPQSFYDPFGSASQLSLPEGYDIWACHTMNQYRAARLSVNQILSAHSSSELRQDLEGLGSCICASVPYHLCTPQVNGAYSLGTYNPIRGLLLLWPLVATATATTKVELMVGVKHWLRVMGEEMGIGQSLVLLEGLEP